MLPGKMVADRAIAACTTTSFAEKQAITIIPAGNAMPRYIWVAHKARRPANAVRAEERTRGITDSNT